MNPQLPIAGYKGEIVKAVQENDVVVITAETGAGKSTQVPQYLMEAGKKVVVTQPRRLAARTLAERVAEENARHKQEISGLINGTRSRLGDAIGYRTAFERMDGPDTRLLFCTDGLQVVRELLGDQRTDVLIIDEVHEWNINIETLVAWTRQQIREGKKTKLVLMSATIDAEKLAKFYGENVPVISVPGRLYPITEEQNTPSEIIPTIKNLVAEGRNVLVFQPGKKEILQTIEDLKDVNAEVLPLHGELTPEEQKRCFKSYKRPKVVVSTNVAQTSVTIDDIDAVVDSGLERRVELSDNIEGLYLKPISQADCKQRKGRAGRCKEGKYILAANEDMADRTGFAKAEIERRRLDQLVLRLASIGLDATELDFFHQPDKNVLQEAKRALHALGAMTKSGKVTEIGHLMAKLPLSVQYSRMLVEAKKHKVMDDVLTIVAILEVGGLRDRTDNWKNYTQETVSDILAELDLWNAAKGKRNSELRDMGIFAKAYWRAKELRQKLSNNMQTYGTTGNRQDILKACVAGMVDHLYQNDGFNEYKNGGIVSRKMARESVVKCNPKWIVGLPKDIQFRNRKGWLCNMNLVNMITKVDPAWLADVAPQLTHNKRRNMRWDYKNSCIVEDEVTVFNGMDIKSDTVEAEVTHEAVKIFARELANGNVNGLYKEAFHNDNLSAVEKSEDLWQRSESEVQKISIDELIALYQLVLEKHGIISSAALDNALREGIIAGVDMKLKPEDYIPADTRERICRQNPSQIEIDGSAYEVKYSSSYHSFKATVQMTIETINTLSQSIIRLPSGRVVTVQTTDRYMEGTDIDKLKQSIENMRLERQWALFTEVRTSKPLRIKPFEPFPELPAPEIYDEKTGSMAYPAIDYYWGNDQLVIKWHKNKETANETNKYTAAKKAEMEDREYERLNFDKLREEAVNLLAEVSKIWTELKEDRNLHKYGVFDQVQIYEINENLRLIEPLLHTQPSDAVRQLKELKIRCGEVQNKKTIFEATQRKKDELYNKLEVEGKILRNFGGHFRRMGQSGNCDYWVIMADGSLKEPDEITYWKGYRSEGNKCWNIVDIDELAIEWSCSTMRSVNGSSVFTVKKLPVKGLTDAQMEAIRRIEIVEIGALEGSFGLDSVIKEKRMKLISEICEFLKTRTYVSNMEAKEENFTALISSDGIYINDSASLLQKLNWAQPFTESCEGREAQLVQIEHIPSGVLEFLAYDKWGHMNINVRFREFTDEEKQERGNMLPAQSVYGGFEHTRDRFFKCVCGCSNRVTKSDIKKYNNGETINISCTGCKTSGSVAKQPKNKESSDTFVPHGSQTGIQDLMGKFNSR